jgi:hypothetical protein
MIKKVLEIIIITLSIAACCSCGKKEQATKTDTAQQMEEAAQKMADAGNKMGEAGEQMAESAEQGGQQLLRAMNQVGQAFSGGEKVETVAFTDLKALLPENLSKMKRTGATGQKQSTMGINMSEAEGTYEMADGPGRLTIKIIDMGTMKGFAAMASAAWTMSEFERESDTGYEKTTSIKGHKGFEKFDKADLEGELKVMVAQRFLIEIDGSQVEMNILHEALDAINLDELAKLQPQEQKESTG